MSNNKQIKKHLELPHQETIVGINTIQTKPFDNQKIETMSNNKQSSVEWLVHHLIDYGFDLSLHQFEIEQAKAMHKEEVTSFTADWSVQYKYEDGKSINKYYNETFGGDN